MIFEKVLVDSSLAVKSAVDCMFGVMRQETTRDGSLKAWFEGRDEKIQYCVKREEEGDD